MAILHISNGGSTAGTLKASNIPGAHLVWDVALVTGPTPLGLSDEAWIGVRADHLAAAYGGEPLYLRNELAELTLGLAGSLSYDEVVLWFEHDLFCQVNLLPLLSWFASHKGTTRLSLVCIDRFPGRKNFRGLGELSAGELESLFPSRCAVTGQMLALGAAAWTAYRSPSPQGIEDLLVGDTTPLPFLKSALLCHLARFPSVENGLGQMENTALDLG